MNLGKYISTQRSRLMLTQEELANRIFVSKSAVAKWETGRGIPDRENMNNLAKVFETSTLEMYQIISGKELHPQEINITNDIIFLLEAYGYSVTKKNKVEEVLD